MSFRSIDFIAGWDQRGAEYPAISTAEKLFRVPTANQHSSRSGVPGQQRR